jgi:hypothetical protein
MAERCNSPDHHGGDELRQRLTYEPATGEYCCTVCGHTWKTMSFDEVVALVQSFDERLRKIEDSRARFG